jgi:uncharacterized protein
MRYLMTLALVCTLAGSVQAQPAQRILDRARELEETSRVWGDRYQRLNFTIVDADGRRRLRSLETYDRKGPGGEQMTIVFFLGSSEVAGLGVLSVSHRERPAEQWLYLPAYKRTRKISAQTRHERVAGSDLTFHDLDILAALPTWTSNEVSAELLDEVELEGVPCHVLALSPRREHIGYQRIVLWLGKEDLFTRQLELYEEAGSWLGGLFGGATTGSAPKRRFRLTGVRDIGSISVAHRIEVETPAEGSRTTIEVTEVRFDQGLEDELFTQRTLERGRRRAR